MKVLSALLKLFLLYDRRAHTESLWMQQLYRIGNLHLKGV